MARGKKSTGSKNGRGPARSKTGPARAARRPTPAAKKAPGPAAASGSPRPARAPQAPAGAKSSYELVGTFEGSERGFGFVRPEAGDAADVFIPASLVGPALHGDRVRIEVRRDGRYGRPYGVVLETVEWGRDPVVGFFNGSMVVPHNPRYQAWVRVAPDDAGEAELGDVVTVEVIRRNVKGVHGRVVRVLGKSDDPRMESRIRLALHGFDEAFPAETLAEAEAAPRRVTAADRAGREDRRDLFTFTIDPESARDFDDAVALERRDGGYRLWVSIADVAHYVRPGSALDQEAYRRATSVYLPDRAVHMLPEALSAGVCSLRPDEDRLALTVELDFDRGGTRTRARFYESTIRSDHRFSYDQVERMETDLELRAEFAEAWAKIEIMRELSEKRRGLRRQRGVIDLDLAEAEVVFGEGGEVADVARRRQTWSHKLIEEFMLSANEAVAEQLRDADGPMVYRVHEPPPPAQVLALAETLAGFGHQLLADVPRAEEIAPRHFQRAIDWAAGGPLEALVKVLCLRAMTQARYRAELRGHFGLASSCYCHFTSPIRRYPDLIVHRLLKALLASGRRSTPGAGPPAVAPERLSAAADHCSERERAAMEVERELVSYYCALWAKDRIGERFAGMVSGVMARGVFVELETAMVEGLVPLEALGGRAEYREEEMAVYVWPGSRKYRIGDRLEVVIVSADPHRRRVNFGLADDPDAGPARSRKAGRR